MEEYGDMQQGRYVNSGLGRNAAYKEAASGAAADMAVMAGEMEVAAKIQVVYKILPQ